MNKTITRKIGKKALTAMLSLTLILGMSGITVFAASSQTGAINGYTTRGASSISSSGASATTSYGSSGSVSVSATYSYVNIKTLATGKMSKTNGYYNNCSVSFSAPSNCRSVGISSSHRVAASGQIWTAKTSATY